MPPGGRRRRVVGAVVLQEVSEDGGRLVHAALEALDVAPLPLPPLSEGVVVTVLVVVMVVVRVDRRREVGRLHLVWESGVFACNCGVVCFCCFIKVFLVGKSV